MTTTPSTEPTLELAWRKYRRWAATSRRQKNEFDLWQRRAIGLAIIGAVLEMISAQMPVWGLDSGYWPRTGQVIAFIGGMFLIVSVAIGRKKIGSVQQSTWIRARSLAESFKSAYFRYRAGIPLWNGEMSASGLSGILKDLDESTDNLRPDDLEDSQELDGFDPSLLDVDDYVKLRVVEQIDRFYRPRAKFHRQEAQRLRKWEFALGIFAALIGLLGGLGLAKYTTAWVAIITNIAVAYATRLAAGRHDFLAVSYGATADRLESLKVRLQETRKAGQSKEDQMRIIEDCEQTISNENKAWGSK